MVHRQQDDAEAQAHRRGVLADCGEHHLGRAAVGPFRQEVVLDEPDTFKPHFLSEPHLINDLPYALVFRLRRGRSGHLYLIEQTEFHVVFPLSEVHHTHAHSSPRGATSAVSPHAILKGVAANSNPDDSVVMWRCMTTAQSVACAHAIVEVPYDIRPQVVLEAVSPGPFWTPARYDRS